MSESEIEFETFDQLDEDVLDVLCLLEREIFKDPYSRAKISNELINRQHLVILIARHQGRPVGFKVGFEMFSDLYYSWIGGVVPEFRGQRLATRLMKMQHELASSKGFRLVRTHTQNRFRNMLLLNIKNGFDVIGVSKNDHDDEVSIILEKRI